MSPDSPTLSITLTEIDTKHQTDPLESAPGTIRGDFSIEVGRNICHGSDSVESANREIALWCVGCALCVLESLDWRGARGDRAVPFGWSDRSIGPHGFVCTDTCIINDDKTNRFPEGVTEWASHSHDWIYE